MPNPGSHISLLKGLLWKNKQEKPDQNDIFWVENSNPPWASWPLPTPAMQRPWTNDADFLFLFFSGMTISVMAAEDIVIFFKKYIFICLAALSLGCCMWDSVPWPMIRSRCPAGAKLQPLDNKQSPTVISRTSQEWVGIGHVIVVWNLQHTQDSLTSNSFRLYCPYLCTHKFFVE